MGARWLKVEEAAIVEDYHTASRSDIRERIPNRTWAQIGVHARRMGVHRTTRARGNSVREGRKANKDAWNDQQNALFDQLYPTQTREQLLAAFPNRTYFAIQAHAQRRHLYRTKEAGARQMNIGREEAKRNDR
jgi:hypothetical protein